MSQHKRAFKKLQRRNRLSVPRGFGVYQVEMPPLPPQPAGQINLSASPQIPPTRVDIAEAIEYNRLVRISRATRDDVARGAIYETAVIAEHAGGAIEPAWFAPIRAQLNRIERGVNVSYNLSCGDGRARPFKVVPFLNGDLPTDAPHNLPALHNEGDINLLLNQEASDYQTGYQGQAAHLVADRKRQIRLEIGRTTGV